MRDRKTIRLQTFELLQGKGELTTKQIQKELGLKYIPLFLKDEVDAGRLLGNVYPSLSGRNGPMHFALSRTGREALKQGTVDSARAVETAPARQGRDKSYRAKREELVS